jgi:dipeptidyl aminopeptidase/acylaminoacyl peptidase
VVILPHGGPESYDRIGFDWLAQAIANQGFLVIQPQFRGSIGFGLEHRLAGYGQWGKKMQDDLSDSLLSLIKKKIVNPEKVCIVGASYGGYAALAGGAFTPDLYQCVVSINGVSDINKMLGSTEYYYGNDHWVLSYWKELVARGDADKNSLAAISPENYAVNFTAPTLLIHSENDQVVLIKQSENMESELKREKKSVKFVELEDDNHHLSTNTGRLRALEEIISFLNKHIG